MLKVQVTITLDGPLEEAYREWAAQQVLPSQDADHTASDEDIQSDFRNAIFSDFSAFVSDQLSDFDPEEGKWVSDYATVEAVVDHSHEENAPGAIPE